jgi:hypothetical protein
MHVGLCAIYSCDAFASRLPFIYFPSWNLKFAEFPVHRSLAKSFKSRACNRDLRRDVLQCNRETEMQQPS